jgi:hypothetical protein
MPSAINILCLIPELAAIGREKLQVYCNEWLQRPIASEFAITHLIVGSDLMLTVNIDDTRARFIDGRVFIPIDELLSYIIDQHFSDTIVRRGLQMKYRSSAIPAAWILWNQIKLWRDRASCSYHITIMSMHGDGLQAALALAFASGVIQTPRGSFPTCRGLRTFRKAVGDYLSPPRVNRK